MNLGVRWLEGHGCGIKHFKSNNSSVTTADLLKCRTHPKLHQGWCSLAKNIVIELNTFPVMLTGNDPSFKAILVNPYLDCPVVFRESTPSPFAFEHYVTHIDCSANKDVKLGTH